MERHIKNADTNNENTVIAEFEFLPSEHCCRFITQNYRAPEYSSQINVRFST